jgi:hypothetical protein
MLDVLIIGSFVLSSFPYCDATMAAIAARPPGYDAEDTVYV